MKKLRVMFMVGMFVFVVLFGCSGEENKNISGHYGNDDSSESDDSSEDEIYDGSESDDVIEPQYLIYYLDSDGDGLGDPSHFVEESSQPDGYVLNSDDCDDGDASIKDLCLYTVVLSAVEDAYVSAWHQDTNYGNETLLVTGITNLNEGEAGEENLSYVKFDLDGIPALANVVSAVLEIRTIYYAVNFDIPARITVGQSASNWAEYEVTYNNRPTGSLRETYVDCEDINDVPIKMDLFSFVTSWLEETDNYGISIGSYAQSNIVKDCIFYSRESFASTLTITYTTN